MLVLSTMHHAMLYNSMSAKLCEAEYGTPGPTIRSSERPAAGPIDTASYGEVLLELHAYVKTSCVQTFNVQLYLRFALALDLCV